MAKDTNFHNLKGLLEIYEPKSKGFLTEEEVEIIEENLEIKSMELLELRNLRDFVVLYMSHRPDSEVKSLLNTMDKMSAITSVIDQAIFSKGGEV